MESESLEKIKVLHNHILQECEKRDFSIWEFEQLINCLLSSRDEAVDFVKYPLFTGWNRLKRG